MSNWFEYPTNYSNGTVANSTGKFIQWASSTISDWFGIGIVLLIFLVTFGLTLSSGSKKAIMVAGFISTIFAILFARLDMINPMIVVSLIIITIIGAIASKGDTSL